ncbi:unnamed protein product [Cylicocyclus nassatus]|uniref:Secreted protein n=1 Tax=Cylicocyclus nassatus TaxID=53992 RepID=A0AA36H0R0_CYLNA|nr:unnamed protein product [Cylicocyclus nassatus]
MRLFLLMCLAAALIALIVVIFNKRNKKNTIAGVNSKNRNCWRKNSKFEGEIPSPWKKNTKFVRKEGDWNIYETRPDKQLEPMNDNPKMGAEIVIPPNAK